MSKQTFKRCGCGKTYTVKQWIDLALVGQSPDETDDGAPAILEFRNCTCGSTLTVLLEQTR